MNKRESWIDIAKAFACVLIVLGHLLIGLQTAGIISSDGINTYFVTSMYFFHVQVFFFCSGFLHQAKAKDGIRAHFCNVLTKLVDLGVPFVAFSTLSWGLKLLFEGAVNTEETGKLWERLLTAPAAPYWYLYILLFIFAISPQIRVKSGVIIFPAMSLMVAVLISFMPNVSVPYFVEWVAKCWIWFALGMACKYLNLLDRGIKWYHVLPWFVFVPLSVAVWYFEMDFFCLDIIMGVLGVGMTVVSAAFVGERVKKFNTSIFVRYTMPVFLMHTIASPAIRAVLLRLGITNQAIHLIVGMLGGIVLPVFAAIIMRMLVLPEIIMYPRPTIKRMKSFLKKK